MVFPMPAHDPLENLILHGLLFAICTAPTQYFAKREGRGKPSFPLNSLNLPDLPV